MLSRERVRYAISLFAGVPVGAAYGIYENGLTFREVVTAWEPARTFAFTIGLAPERPAPAPYDGIGERYLELLSARYTIESAGDGTVVLVLESAHRVTTRFNEYSGGWTEFILADLQGYLLRIVKDRAEAARSGAAARISQ